MAKYRLKPDEVEVEQYKGEIVKGICVLNCLLNYSLHVHPDKRKLPILVYFGDYIIPEEDGNYYFTLEPKMFESMYELVKEEEEKEKEE